MNYQNLEKLTPFLDKLKTGHSLLLLTLGDSNTNNTNFTNGAKQWPELLHSRLKDEYRTQKLLLLNAGVSGDTIADALERYDTDVARFLPDLTIVCLGSNDANRLTDAEYELGLNECMDRLQLTSSIILLRTPTPIMQSDGPHVIWNEDYALQAKCQVTRKIVYERELAFVDTYQLWRDEEAQGQLVMEELMTDAVHTNALGHRRVYEQLLPAFGINP